MRYLIAGHGDYAQGVANTLKFFKDDLNNVDLLTYNNDFEQQLQAYQMCIRDRANPHVHQTLNQLKNTGWRLALASSSPRANIEQVLRELAILPLFEVIASGNDFRESKPNPEIYLHVAAELRCV